jgi:hypothetical protein
MAVGFGFIVQVRMDVEQVVEVVQSVPKKTNVEPMSGIFSHWRLGHIPIRQLSLRNPGQEICPRAEFSKDTHRRTQPVLGEIYG